MTPKEGTMKTVDFVIYPFVRQECSIDVPDDVEVDLEYIEEHWDDIRFGFVEPEYDGAEIEV